MRIGLAVSCDEPNPQTIHDEELMDALFFPNERYLHMQARCTQRFVLARFGA